MNNQNLQQPIQPIFAPANKYDGDIDLSDIFAEYLNDGTDPLTTFSNYGGMQMMQQTAPLVQTPPTASLMLPTGGIRTAFHSSAVPNIAQPAYQQQGQQNVQDQQQMQIQQTEGYEQAQKKARISEEQYPQIQPQAAVPINVSTSGSGITGRLGYSVEGGQLTMPVKAPQAAFQTGAVSVQSGIQLPVGFGIRVAGVGAAAAPGGAAVANNLQYGATGATPGHGGTSAHLPMWAGDGGGGGLSDQAVAERRQRNREHAKRSRVRKKFLLESLQADVRELQVENANLRMVIQSKIPQQAQQIISECCAKNPLFDDSNMDEKQDGSRDANGVELDNSDYSLIQSLTSGQQNFVLSDPRLPDNPIVYASDGFYQLTGYTREQVLGRNCRFLQGPGTDPKAVDVIRTAVANGTDATTCLLNYKADGTPFWNQFFVAALRDSDNCIVNYVGVQCAIDPEAGASALEDKVNSVLPLANKEGELEN